MRKIFFTVGPTQVHPKLREYIEDALARDICSISHRGKAFEEVFEHTSASVKKLLNVPDGFNVFFLGSGTEAMEKIIENCVAERSFHLVNGAFSKRFFTTAEELKRSPEALKAGMGEGFDMSSVHVPAGAEMVCITENETSTGVAVNVSDIHALKRANPDKLFAVDIVSSTPYSEIDYSLIDCAFFSVQKGFGMPAGLGVLIVSDACIEKSRELQKKGINIGSFHNFPTLLASAEKHQTPETPNVLGIYLLGKISDEYNEYGVEKIRKETEQKAKLLYDFFDAHPTLKPFVKDPAWRSQTTLVIETPGGSGSVLKKLADKSYIVASGYGAFKDAHIRIANFPMHTLKDFEGMLRILGTVA